MKVGELARQLGIDRTTIYEWLKIEGVDRLLSTSARGDEGMQRVFSADDADVINTIRHIKHQNRHMAWDEILRQLEEGLRITLYPSAALRLDSRVVSVPQAEQAVEAAKLQAERDAALKLVEELRNRVTEIEHEKEDLRRTLTQQIIELSRQIGRLEGKLEEKEKGD